MLRRRRDDEYIPIKIEGWNGKFVYNKTPTLTGPKNSARQQQSSNISNFYGFSPDTEKLPPKWDGTFVGNSSGGVPQIRNDRNQSNETNFFGYNTETEILPTTWSGKFQMDPNDIRMKPERNRSDTQEMYGFNTEPEILPVQWDGHFQLDPNDIRIKPERNVSDVRDYGEAHRYHQRNGF